MEKRGKKDEKDIKALVSHEISAARQYDQSELSDKRSRAIDYYFGDMADTPAPPNRSSVVSRDTSDVIGWMLPGIIRTFTASGRMVEFEPVGMEDEDGADQASDYIHYQFAKVNDGYRILYNATHDALLQKNGIVKTWWDATPETDVSTHEGLDEDALALLIGDDDAVEVLAQTEREEPIAEEERAQMAEAAAVAMQEQTAGMVNPQMAPAPIPTEPPTSRIVYDVKIQRTKRHGKICVESIAPEDFLMNKDAIYIDKARFVGHRQEKTRSDLIEMGYDPEKVKRLAKGVHENYSEEELARLEESTDFDDAMDDSTTLIELHECYVRMDVDGDGIAELVKVDYAGYQGAGEILEWQVWEDDIPFDDIPCEPVPHRFDGLSIFDYVCEEQRVKTVLRRQMLDNVYAHNMPQPVVREGVVINRDALINPKYGQPIYIRRTAPDKPLEWRDTPFVADKTLLALNHVDETIERRTGVSRASMALDPEALQNQTATAVQKQQDAQYSKVELIARNMAELGWKKVFRKMLKLAIRYQNRPEMIRLRGEWAEMDPRQWNADMDCTVNVGLGSGSRDRDMGMLNVMLQQMTGLAGQLAEYGMTGKAIEFLPKIRDVMVKIGESAGIRNSEDYYPEFPEDELAQMAESAGQQEDPKIQLEREKAQIDMQKQQAQMQMDSHKMQAEMQMNNLRQQSDMELARAKMEQDIALKREQLSAELALKREQLAAELVLKREQMQAELAIKREVGMHTANVNGASKVVTSGVHMGGEPG